MRKAFVLGAGLGTRLKSLTELLPKPLIPFFQRPLISFAFDHAADIGVEEFVVNTHHRAEAYADHFPNNEYRGRPIHFRYEEILLETGGGIANVADLLGDEPFLVYNGDILTDLPLGPALEQHKASGNMVTMILRTEGFANHVAFDEATGKITDIKNLRGTGNEGAHQFTGIYFVEPEFQKWLTPGEKKSVIPVFLDIIEKEDRIGGVVVDEGVWWDLGNRDSYLDVHRSMEGGTFPIYNPEHKFEKQVIHPTATVDPSAKIEHSAIGAGAKIGADCILENCIIWRDAEVEPGSRLERCIVRSGQIASGELSGVDV